MQCFRHHSAIKIFSFKAMKFSRLVLENLGKLRNLEGGNSGELRSLSADLNQCQEEIVGGRHDARPSGRQAAMPTGRQDQAAMPIDRQEKNNTSRNVLDLLTLGLELDSMEGKAKLTLRKKI